MKRLVVVMVLVLSASLVFASGTVQDKILTRKEKRKAESAQQYALTKSMIENRDFVLESNWLDNRYGYRFVVSPGINFVKVANNEAVIQVGSNYRIGPNGVGGVTAKGRITSWKVTQNKDSKTYNILAVVSTPIGIYDLYFNVRSDGLATARLSGLWSGHLTFNGNLVPVNDSGVYEGWSI